MYIADRNELLAADHLTDADAHACIVQYDAAYDARDH